MKVNKRFYVILKVLISFFVVSCVRPENDKVMVKFLWEKSYVLRYIPNSTDTCAYVHYEFSYDGNLLSYSPSIDCRKNGLKITYHEKTGGLKGIASKLGLSNYGSSITFRENGFANTYRYYFYREEFYFLKYDSIGNITKQVGNLKVDGDIFFIKKDDVEYKWDIEENRFFAPVKKVDDLKIDGVEINNKDIKLPKIIKEKVNQMKNEYQKDDTIP